MYHSTIGLTSLFDGCLVLLEGRILWLSEGLMQSSAMVVCRTRKSSSGTHPCHGPLLIVIKALTLYLCHWHCNCLVTFKLVLSSILYKIFNVWFFCILSTTSTVNMCKQYMLEFSCIKNIAFKLSKLCTYSNVHAANRVWSKNVSYLEQILFRLKSFRVLKCCLKTMFTFSMLFFSR